MSESETPPPPIETPPAVLEPSELAPIELKPRRSTGQLVGDLAACATAIGELVRRGGPVARAAWAIVRRFL